MKAVVENKKILENRAEELVSRVKSLKADVNSKHQDMSSISFTISSLKMVQAKMNEHFLSLTSKYESVAKKQDLLEKELRGKGETVMAIDMELERVLCEIATTDNEIKKSTEE